MHNSYSSVGCILQCHVTPGLPGPLPRVLEIRICYRSHTYLGPVPTPSGSTRRQGGPQELREGLLASLCNQSRRLLPNPYPTDDTRPPYHHEKTSWCFIFARRLGLSSRASTVISRDRGVGQSVLFSSCGLIMPSLVAVGCHARPPL
jgi:hypothetical protein